MREEGTGRAGKGLRRKAPALGAKGYDALAEFRYFLRRFLEFSRSAAGAAGLTPQQHQALLAIKGFGGRGRATVGGLAGRLLLRHHSAVGLVDRLCDLGLVLRRTDPRDRRRVLLSLTAKAERVLGGLSAVHLEEIRRLRPFLADLLAKLGGE